MPKQHPNEHAIIHNALIPLTKLHPHPANYNQHGPEQITRIAVSLRRFGQPRSIVCWLRDDGDYWIIAGHGVVLGAQSESWTEIRADILPRNYPESDALGFLAADNEIARLSEPDETLLAELLQEQANAGYPLESLGSSQAELDALLARLGDEVDSELPEFHDVDESVEDDLPTEMCQQCGKLCLKPGAKPPKS